MNSTEILDYTLAALSVAGSVAAFFGLGPKIRTWLGARADELAASTGFSFIARIDDFMIALATDLYKREIKTLKDAGKWNENTKRDLMSTLVETTKEHFGVDKLLGLVSTNTVKGVDVMLAGQGQMAILNAKIIGAAAKKAKPEILE